MPVHLQFHVQRQRVCMHARRRMLLEHGADLEEKDRDGLTAMHWAVHTDNTACAIRLVSDT